VEGLNSWYGRAHILFDVTSRWRPGEVVALLGRNGAGKTTTFTSIMGILPGVTGEVVFEGTRDRGMKPHEIARLGLGYVPEDRRIFTDLTVEENLEVGRRPPRPGSSRGRPSACTSCFPTSPR
jgi:branched-chain amino acid transport system ATP-binding protein